MMIHELNTNDNRWEEVDLLLHCLVVVLAGGQRTFAVFLTVLLTSYLSLFLG